MLSQSSTSDIHSKALTTDALDAALTAAPHRIEEVKRVEGFGSLTPLLAAAYWGNIEVAEYLITHGANIHAADLVNEAMMFIFLHTTV
jgi:hypothetical protein